MRIPDDPTTAHEANPSLGAPSLLRSARLSLNSPHQLVALALATTVLAPAGGATSGIVAHARGEAQFGSLEVWLADLELSLCCGRFLHDIHTAVGSYMTYMYMCMCMYVTCMSCRNLPQ